LTFLSLPETKQSFLFIASPLPYQPHIIYNTPFLFFFYSSYSLSSSSFRCSYSHFLSYFSSLCQISVITSLPLCAPSSLF
jgi:hypothetical protein